MSTSPQDHEVDPTGIRELLSSLPDPGPMPEGLVARIQSALAHEQELRSQHVASVGGVADVADVADAAHVPPPPQAPHHHRIVDLARYRDRRARGGPARFLPWAAAAGFVALAGGGLLAGGNLGGLSAAVGGSAASGSSVSVAAGAVASRQSGAAEALGDTNASSATQLVLATGATWTPDTLAPAAATLVSTAASTPATATTPESAASVGSEPIATAQGARECATALGVAAHDDVIIDLGTYAGTPAGLLVAIGPAGERTAYVVSRDCRTGAPGVLANAIGF